MSGRVRVWVLGAALAALAIVLYARVHDYGFVGYDDPEYVTEDRRIQDGLSWPGVAWPLAPARSATGIP